MEDSIKIMKQVTLLATSNFTEGWGHVEDYEKGSEEYQNMLQALKKLKARMRYLADNCKKTPKP